MSKPHPVNDRKRWLAWLRANPNLQLHGGTKLTVGGREGRHICAMEAAQRIVGVNEREDPCYDETGRRIGLTSKQVDKVEAMNDGAQGERLHSFQEIADVVETWPVAIGRRD